MINFTFNSSRAESGSMTGLNDSECGQIGVNSMHGTFGWTCSFPLSLDNNIKEGNDIFQYIATWVQNFIYCTNTNTLP